MTTITKPTVFTTPSGDRMAVLPLAEYERLLEAIESASEVRAFDEAKRKLASGEEEMIPSAMVKRILDGDNPVRVWREHRGLSAKELAERAGISAPFLSQIESGKRDGGLDTLRSIAKALAIKVDDLT